MRTYPLAVLAVLFSCGAPEPEWSEPVSVTLAAKGLYTQPSLIGEDIPDGAAVVADNVAIRRDGIWEPRRGVSAYTTLVANRLFAYATRLISHSSTGTISYDNGSGTFTALSGTFAPPSSTTAKTRAALAAQDFFFTTSAGVYRMDAYNSTPLLAGAVKATGFDRDGRVYTCGVGTMSLTANVVTANTSAAHGFYVGQVVTQTSATEAPYTTGNHTILTVPSATSFTYAQVAGNDAANANVHTFAPAALATAGGFLTDGNQVAYRVVFNCPDTNNREKPGAASPRTIIANATGTNGWVTTEAKNVIVRAFIPSGITTSHSIRLYRSKQVATTIEPEDELQLVYEALVKTNEISQGWMDITDVTPDAMRGATIYVAPSQEGFAQNNDAPPLAQDLTAFGNSMHYANTIGLHRMVINLLAVGGSGGVQDGNTFTIDGATFTATASTPTLSTEFFIESSGTVSQKIRNTALNLCATINRSAICGSRALYASGADDPPGKILLERKTLGGSAFTPVLGGSTATAVERAAWAPTMNAPSNKTYDLSRTGTVVTATPSTGNNLFITGESVTLAVGNVNFPAGAKTITSASIASFTYTESGAATTLATQSFGGTNTFSSSADTIPNRVYHSKTNLPEAVPLYNYNDVGSKDAQILRIIALRDAMFAFKEDGLFKGTGRTGAFTWEIFDPTVKLLAPDSAVTLGNQIYAWTNQGVLAISETGSEIVSRPIEKTLLGIAAADLAHAQQVTFGVGYETDHTYELRTITSAGDTTATQAFLFNTLTRTWVRDTIESKCGVVNPVDDKRYLGGASQILQERKALTYADYSDADIAVTVNSLIDHGVQLVSTAGVSVGDVLVQGSTEGLITAVNGLEASTDVEGWTEDVATVKKAIPSVIQWAPVTGKKPDASKLWQETNFLLGNAHLATATASHSTELITTFEATPIDAKTVAGQWTLASVHWDGTERPFNLRLSVPQEERRSTRLNVKWAVTNAWAAWNISGLSILYAQGSERTSR